MGWGKQILPPTHLLIRLRNIHSDRGGKVGRRVNGAEVIAIPMIEWTFGGDWNSDIALIAASYVLSKKKKHHMLLLMSHNLLIGFEKRSHTLARKCASCDIIVTYGRNWSTSAIKFLDFLFSFLCSFMNKNIFFRHNEGKYMS